MKRPADSDIYDDALNSARKGDAAAEDELAGIGSEQGGNRLASNEVMGDIVEQARHVQRVAEKIYFLSILKRFGLAFGGILLLLGTLAATAFFLLFFGVFSTGFPKNIELLVEIGLALLATIHILAGLTLLAG